jgi:predicted XRE-type DNA-binding protein
MELWEIFSNLLTQNNVKIADVSNATGLPYTTVDSIIKKKLKDIKFSSAKKNSRLF